MLLIPFLITISLLGVKKCLASPSPSLLSSRQITDERVHLTDCTGNSETSVVVYCKNDSVCNKIPAENDICVMAEDSLFAWEQRTQGCTFQGTSTRFVWDLEPDARDNKFAKDAVVGSGSNGFHRFNCLKNNDPVLFTDNQGRQCKSLYYCINIT
ncbi:hypothetical protein QBC44DRAFT_325665 [Cladorrhinum sp. PSN332]|nr:hypothetical protein QBC44DRAFT_325665 [Cladorrhinum sp. PSN332]